MAHESEPRGAPARDLVDRSRRCVRRTASGPVGTPLAVPFPTIFWDQKTGGAAVSGHPLCPPLETPPRGGGVPFLQQANIPFPSEPCYDSRIICHAQKV